MGRGSFWYRKRLPHTHTHTQFITKNIIYLLGFDMDATNPMRYCCVYSFVYIWELYNCG